MGFIGSPALPPEQGREIPNEKDVRKKIPPNLELNPIFGPARARQQHPSLRRRRVSGKVMVCPTSMILWRSREGMDEKNGNAVEYPRIAGEGKGNLSSLRGNEMGL